MRRLIVVLAATLFLSVSWQAAEAQTTFRPDESKFIMNGSANTGAWDCKSTRSTGRLVNNSDDQTIKVTRLDLTLPVEGFDCGRSQMTDNMYKYIKKDDHPRITYRLQRTLPAEIDANGGEVLMYGTLTVAGVSQDIRTRVKVEKNGNGWRLTGKHPLKMTEFGIDPPTAVFGTVRSRDEVEIEFSLVFR